MVKKKEKDDGTGEREMIRDVRVGLPHHQSKVSSWNYGITFSFSACEGSFRDLGSPRANLQRLLRRK